MTGPPVEIASGEGSGGPVLIEDGVVYFLGGGCVCKWTEGADAQKLGCTDAPRSPFLEQSLAADATHLFALSVVGTDDSCPIHRIPKAGGTAEVFVEAPVCPGTIAVGGGFLYGAGTGSVWKAAIPSGAFTTLSEVPGSAAMIGVFGEEVWFNHRIASVGGASMAASGSTDPDLVWSRPLDPIVRDDDTLFGVEFEKSLLAFDLAKRTERTLAPLDKTPGDIAVSPTHVFVTQYERACAVSMEPPRADMTLLAIPRAGGAATRISEGHCIRGLAVDEAVAVIASSTVAVDCSAPEPGGPALLIPCVPARWAVTRLPHP